MLVLYACVRPDASQMSLDEIFNLLPKVMPHEGNRDRLAVSYFAERGWNLSSTMLVACQPFDGSTTLCPSNYTQTRRAPVLAAGPTERISR